jgi:hypothetical protein
MLSALNPAKRASREDVCRCLSGGLGEDEVMLGELKVGDQEDSVFGHSICGISKFTSK